MRSFRGSSQSVVSFFYRWFAVAEGPLIHIVPYLSGGSWLVIAMMAALNPSNTLAAHGPVSVSATVAIAGAAIAVLVPRRLVVGTVRRKNPRSPGRFLIEFAIGLLLLLVCAAVAAFLVHRDFHSWYAHIIVLYATLFLFLVDSVDLVVRRHHVYHTLFLISLALFILIMVWIMLMSWAIVIRAEPRWIESTAYNVAFGLIAMVFAWSAASLRERAYRIVRIEDRAVFVDDYDISTIFSEQERTLLVAFLTAGDAPITCSVLYPKLRNDAQENENPCERCLQHDWSPSKCAHYRNIKNRIAGTRKAMELLRLGTIAAATGRTREIRTAGWRAVIDASVRLHDARGVEIGEA